MPEPDLYLASRSPRRAELLRQIGVEFEILELDVDETPEADEAPDRYVRRVAEEKAWAGIAIRRRELPVLGADTAVVLDGEILGKPRDGDDAVSMLMRLSGRRHRVLSALAIADGRRREVALNETRVWFSELAESECRAYWNTGEPADKAGAYAIQGLGAVFVERIEGSYSGVMGLPLFDTARLLRRFRIATFR